MDKNITWNEFFMSLAKINAQRSKDPNTKVGCVIIDSDKRVVGMGYNGMPQGDDNFPWGRDGEPKDTKYPYVIHAELNAILNSKVLLKDKTLYTTLFPCSNCAKVVAQSGITKIYYSEDKYNGTDDDIISKKILDQLNIEYIKIEDFEVKIIKNA